MKRQVPHPTQKSAFTTIVAAGLIAGTLDISSAILIYAYKTERGPALIFRYIASALLGEAAFSGGTGMLWLGLLLHFIIAFIFTVLLFFTYPYVRPVLKDKYIIGIAYGVFIWLVMNLLVLPLSRVPANAITIAKFVEGTLTLILMVGLPLALIFQPYYSRKKRSKKKAASRS